MEREPEHDGDLDAVLAAAWRLLARGVRDRHAPAHTPALATLTAAGTPTVRTVVLRGCDPARRQLVIHTDRRSGKVAEIAACPAGMVHVYEPARKLQLRLTCHLQVHMDDALAGERWAGSRPRSRECYQVTAAPGSALADPAATVFDAAATRDGAEHFAVVSARVDALEWLYLAEAGHRRARFTWHGDEAGAACEATWLVP